MIDTEIIKRLATIGTMYEAAAPEGQKTWVYIATDDGRGVSAVKLMNDWLEKDERVKELENMLRLMIRSSAETEEQLETIKIARRLVSKWNETMIILARQRYVLKQIHESLGVLTDHVNDDEGSTLLVHCIECLEAELSKG